MSSETIRSSGGLLLSLREDNNKRINAMVGVVAVIVLIILALTVPNFFRMQNIVNVLESVSSVGFYSLGLTIVLVSGGIDLSVPGVIMAAACLGGSYMVHGGNWFVAFLMMLGLGILFGLINGLAVAKGKMIPFIVTLSTLVLSRGIAEYLSAAQTIYGLPDEFLALDTKIGIVPIGVIVFIAVAILLMVLLTRTRLGRTFFLVGENIETARVSGIKTDMVLFLSYLISGFLAGIGAVFLTARLGSATATMVGDTVTNNTIASCIIGGASLRGGQGNIVGSVLGLIFITIVDNCFNLLGIGYYVGMVFKGLIVALVIYIDVLRSKG
ncbi:MAG: ABC transporter permease [Clostridiaceae bacterium]|jgi:ribose transport system permease protein|nr:ABC transporter permease [Clostridiaceae bacterium]